VPQERKGWLRSGGGEGLETEELSNTPFRYSKGAFSITVYKDIPLASSPNHIFGKRTLMFAFWGILVPIIGFCIEQMAGLETMLV